MLTNKTQVSLEYYRVISSTTEISQPNLCFYQRNEMDNKLE